MPNKQTIQVPSLKSTGPYSQAVRAGGLLFVSGQPGINPSTAESAGPTFEAQARQAFQNLDAVLRAGGSRLDLVANTSITIADLAHFPDLNRSTASSPSSSPPSRPPAWSSRHHCPKACSFR
jgi:2-iminobutanoate/2-iminopropanoate deaminase